MSISSALKNINDQLAAAAKSASRDEKAVRLMAVSKLVESPRIAEAINAGQRLFGENYVQEAKSKWPDLRAKAEKLEVHLIGPLQTNKAKDAVMLFDSIDTLDRPKLAQALASAMEKTGRRIPLMIEVNIGREPQKHGSLPEDVSALLAEARALGLDVRGLMAVPPAGVDPAPYFADMASLAKTHALPELSLGMSGDFQAAIAAGSTMIRIGTAIFGERKS